MHQRKGKKILIYLFLFLIVGSINNIALTKINFEKIKSIEISGLNQNQNINLLDISLSIAIADGITPE